MSTAPFTSNNGFETIGNISTTSDMYGNNIIATSQIGSYGDGNFGGSVGVQGNLIVNGIETNVVRKGYGIYTANTAITLDNIEARLGGTPMKLYINTVDSNMTGAGQSQTMTSGSTTTSSWINVPIGIGQANAFAMSGTLTSNGDTVVLNLVDQGNSTGMWRITGMIGNTTANRYSVSIERLV